MFNNKKTLLIIAAIILLSALIYMIYYFNQSPLERRFSTIIKEYDKQYSARLKNYETNEILRIYDITNDEKSFLVAEKGYNDVILIFAVLDSTEIKSVDVLYHNETKDYGDYVTQSWFLQRLIIPYENKLKTVRRNKNNQNEVIAITGATITSDAVVQAINNCIDIMEDLENEK